MAKHTANRTIGAVETNLDLLEELRRRGRAGVTELADAIDASKATVHTHLTTLLEAEYVVRSGESYRLGGRYLALGEAVRQQASIYDAAREETDALAEETGEVAQLAIEEHGRAVYLYKARGDDAVNTASTVGTREYLHCTALGKAMLSVFSERRVESVIDRHGLPERTGQTLTDRDELFDEIERTRERGHAVDDEEVIEGIRCIAHPLTGDENSVLGAISVSGPASRMDGEWFDRELPRLVERAANVVVINTKFS
jgi:DNA-binding IclR family transcriptional regulator